MSSPSGSPDVLVVGGGIIGLAVAWRARQRGMSVALLERERSGVGASRVAAGMLAPVSEVEFGHGGRRLLKLGLQSVTMWPQFAAELLSAAGEDVHLRTDGTLLLARNDDDARELERQLAFRKELDLRAVRLRPSAAREREPALAPTIRLALELPDDHSVDPRRVTMALRTACERAGVRVREHVDVVGLLAHESTVSGVELAGGERARAEQVVLAAGAWTAGLAGLPPEGGARVRPVKGQTLRLRDPAGPGLIERSVRFPGGYLVPRSDGRYVLGGTVEEQGFDTSSTAGAAYELLRNAHEIVPGVRELQLEELCVGLRPGTPDNVPAVGRGKLAGLVWATGHYRNGILLAPLTAELVAGVLAGDETDPLLQICDPARFEAAGPGDARSARTPEPAST